MDERSQRQQIFSAALRHLPRYLRGMRRRVSEHSEHALYQIGKATLFAKLTPRSQLIDSERWRIATQGPVNQCHNRQARDFFISTASSESIPHPQLQVVQPTLVKPSPLQRSLPTP